MGEAILKVTAATPSRRAVASNESRNWTERELVWAALQLGARDVAGWSREEDALAAKAAPVGRAIVKDLRERIANGGDPLGELFSELRTPEERRDLGATYTPAG